MSEVDLSALSAASAMLVETTAARVVRVTAGRRELSGLVWTDDQIVTAEECIADDEGLAVVLADGRSLAAEMIGRDPSTDVALLRANTGPQSAWEVADRPVAGAFAWAVGREKRWPGSRLWRRRAGPVQPGPAPSGGRIEARIPTAVPAPAGNRRRGSHRCVGASARSGRCRSSAADAGHSGRERSRLGRGAGRAWLRRSRLPRAGVAAAAPRSDRTDRRRSRRGGAGRGGRASRR